MIFILKDRFELNKFIFRDYNKKIYFLSDYCCLNNEIVYSGGKVITRCPIFKKINCSFIDNDVQCCVFGNFQKMDKAGLEVNMYTI